MTFWMNGYWLDSDSNSKRLEKEVGLRCRKLVAQRPDLESERWKLMKVKERKREGRGRQGEEAERLKGL